jgi:hypothetical protein
VRAGRHSYTVQSLSNDIVIDVSRMFGMTINGDGTATVEAGVKNYQVQSTLWKSGFMIPIGTCPSVGGGFFLGGGYSVSSRWLGLGVDAITGFEIVLANGDIVNANARENPDLFWALRGAGGGNFGVVTRVTLRLTALPPVVSLARFEWTSGKVALPVWEKFLVDNFNLDKLVPQGYTNFNGGARANIFYFGPLAELKALLDPLKAAGTPKSYSEKEVPYSSIMHQFAGCKDPVTVASDDPTSCQNIQRIMPKARPTIPQETQSPWVAASAYVNKPYGAKWDAFMTKLTSLPGVICIIDPHGGAANRIARDATAYPHRDALFHIQIMSYFTSEVGRPRAQTNVQAMYQWLEDNGMVSGSYINYPNFFMLQRSNYMERYYVGNYARLQSVKQRYDPKNVFSHPFGIKVPGQPQALDIAPPPIAASVIAPAPSSSSATFAVVRCGQAQAPLRLVEVEKGGAPVLSTEVTACTADGRLNIRYSLKELPGNVQPVFKTAGCNDNTNPPFKSNAVEAFLGFAADQSQITDYLEIETMPKGFMWMANIKYGNGRIQVGKRSYFFSFLFSFK